MCSSIDQLQGFFQDSDQGEGGGGADMYNCGIKLTYIIWL